MAPVVKVALIQLRSKVRLPSRSKRFAIKGQVSHSSLSITSSELHLSFEMLRGKARIWLFSLNMHSQAGPPNLRHFDNV